MPPLLRRNALVYSSLFHVITTPVFFLVLVLGRLHFPVVPYRIFYTCSGVKDLTVFSTLQFGSSQDFFICVFLYKKSSFWLIVGTEVKFGTNLSCHENV